MIMDKARNFLEKTAGGGEADRVSRLTLPPHLKTSFYEYFILRGIRLDRVEPGAISCYFKVPPRLIDRNGNLSMGAISSFVDEIGAAVIHQEGQPMDVSVDMSISFISDAKVNINNAGGTYARKFGQPLDVPVDCDELEIMSRFLGRQGGYSGTHVLIRNKTTGDVVAEGRHSLFTKPVSKM